MRLRKKQKKDIIIIVLLIMVVGMTIAFSALSNLLVINGTSATTGNLQVEFIDIQESAMIDATTIKKDYEGTVANFQVDLKKPGSYAEYELTVQNKGNIDVYLNDIKGLTEANDKEPYEIYFELKDFFYDELLKAGETKKFKVSAIFSSYAYELPTTSKDLTLELIYSQDQTGEHTPTLPGDGSVEDIFYNDLKYDIDSPIKNGLYAVDDNGELTTLKENTVEYRYIGANPNNYVLIENELWRIMGFSKYGDQMWVIKNDSLSNIPWNDNGVNNWQSSSLYEYFIYNSKIKNYFDVITLGGLGNDYISTGTALTFKIAEKLEEIQNYEFEYQLISPSDYGFATAGGETTSRSQCLAQALASWNDPTYSDCINNNWLNFSGSYWTITKNSDTLDSVFIKNTDGSISTSLVTENHDVYPVVLLKYFKVSGGMGTINNPYILLSHEPS